MKTKNENKDGNRNIILLGLVSCFADISSEMVYPIIPLYLTAVLGATPALVGVIEGIALLPASVIAGLLWNGVGAFAPFVYGGCMSLIAVVLLAAGLKQKTAQ